jgi:hypothetical protein
VKRGGWKNSREWKKRKQERCCCEDGEGRLEVDSKGCFRACGGGVGLDVWARAHSAHGNPAVPKKRRAT